MRKKEVDVYFIQFPDPRYTPDWNMPYSMVQAEVTPETVGQYTELKDRKGKEIYEGDIVKLKFRKNSLDIIIRTKLNYIKNKKPLIIQRF